MINVCDIQVMKPLLAQQGFHFSKAKGQNFLIAPWVPASIAEASGVDETSLMRMWMTGISISLHRKAEKSLRWSLKTGWRRMP